MKKTFKEYLKPTGYSEGIMSLVTHNGILYKLDRIFELSIDLPVTQLSLDGLRWMINAVPVRGEKKVDTRVPIIVTPQGGQYIIIDGMHRVAKALKAGDKTIPARVIFHDILAQAKMGANHPCIGNQGDLNPYLNEARMPHNSWAVLNASRALFEKNKVTIAEIKREWKFYKIMVLKIDDGKVVMMDGTGHKVGEEHDLHNDQTFVRMSHAKVVGMIDCSSDDPEKWTAEPKIDNLQKFSAPIYVFK